MKKIRFTNGLKKVLDRKFGASDVDLIVQEEINKIPQLWERGEGDKSLMSSSAGNKADGDYSFVVGKDASAIRDYEGVFASGNKFLGQGAVLTNQKNEIVLSAKILDKGTYDLLDASSNNIEIPEYSSWKGRFIAQLNDFDHWPMITSWSGIFTAIRSNGAITIKQHTVNLDQDDNGNNYTLAVGVAGNILRFLLASKAGGAAIYAQIHVEWIELSQWR